MSERPIRFSGPMVHAILEDKKTQTRRIVKLPPASQGWRFIEFAFNCEDSTRYRAGFAGNTGFTGSIICVNCPYGKPPNPIFKSPGDRLWVREGHALDGSQVVYRAGNAEAESSGPRVDVRWRPSIFMPRWASRITLEITSVRVERLQQISEADAMAEGIGELPLQEGQPGAWWAADLTQPKLYGRSAIDAYSKLWQSINGAGSWDANPWVWVVEFRRLSW